MEPVILENHLGSHRVNLVARGASEMLQEVLSMNFVVFYFRTASNNRVGTNEVVECALLSENIAFTQVTKDNVFLWFLIEGAAHLISRKQDFADSPENNVDIVAILINFLDLKAFGNLFFYKVDFKIFKQPSRQETEARHKPD